MDENKAFETVTSQKIPVHADEHQRKLRAIVDLMLTARNVVKALCVEISKEDCLKNDSTNGVSVETANDAQGNIYVKVNPGFREDVVAKYLSDLQIHLLILENKAVIQDKNPEEECEHE